MNKFQILGCGIALTRGVAASSMMMSVALFVGCGQKGPLYLETVPRTAAPAAPVAASNTPEKATETAPR